MYGNTTYYQRRPRPPPYNPPLSILLIMAVCGIGLGAVIGLALLCYRHRIWIKTTLTSIWTNREINQKGAMAKFARKGKIQGLRDATKPDQHILRRLVYATYVFVMLAFGIHWTVYLYQQLTENPIIYAYDELKVPIRNVTFPEIKVIKPFTLKLSVVEELERLYKEANFDDVAKDSNGMEWNKDEATVLMQTVKHLCNPLKDEKKWDDLDKRSSVDNHQIAAGVPHAEIYEFSSNDTENASFYKNKLMPQLKKVVPACSDMIKACVWGAKRIDCKDAFSDVLTDTGPACAFNRLPNLMKRRMATMQTLFTEEEICGDDAQIYDDADDLILVKPRNRTEACMKKVHPFQKTIPLTQNYGGPHFGLGWIAQFDTEDLGCPQHDGLSYSIGISSIYDDGDTYTEEVKINLNHDVRITMDPVIVISEDVGDIEDANRDCILANENKNKPRLDLYEFYTEGNCLKECQSKTVVAKCKCGMAGLPNFPGQKLCSTLDDMNCATNTLNEGMPCTDCLSGCSNIFYKVGLITSDPYTPGTAPAIVKDVTSDAALSSRVQMGFNDHHVFVIMKQPKYTAYDIFGLMGGTVSFTNGMCCIDLLRLLEATFEFVKDRVYEVIEYVTRSGTLQWPGLLRRKRREEEEERRRMIGGGVGEMAAIVERGVIALPWYDEDGGVVEMVEEEEVGTEVTEGAQVVVDQDEQIMTPSPVKESVVARFRRFFGRQNKTVVVEPDVEMQQSVRGTTACEDAIETLAHFAQFPIYMVMEDEQVGGGESSGQMEGGQNNAQPEMEEQPDLDAAVVDNSELEIKTILEEDLVDEGEGATTTVTDPLTEPHPTPVDIDMPTSSNAILKYLATHDATFRKNN